MLCSWNERDKECIQNFSEEAFWKWPFGRQIRWEDNINMDRNILLHDNGRWMKLSQNCVQRRAVVVVAVLSLGL